MIEYPIWWYSYVQSQWLIGCSFLHNDPKASMQSGTEDEKLKNIGQIKDVQFIYLFFFLQYKDTAR